MMIIPRSANSLAVIVIPIPKPNAMASDTASLPSLSNLTIGLPPKYEYELKNWWRRIEWT